MTGSEVEFEGHASKIQDQLERGCPVYLPSLGYPERDVLNYLYRSLAPERTMASISNLAEREFLDSFPIYRFRPIAIDLQDGIYIYQLGRRKQLEGPLSGNL